MHTTNNTKNTAGAAAGGDARRGVRARAAEAHSSAARAAPLEVDVQLDPVALLVLQAAEAHRAKVAARRERRLCEQALEDAVRELDEALDAAISGGGCDTPGNCGFSAGGGCECVCSVRNAYRAVAHKQEELELSVRHERDAEQRFHYAAECAADRLFTDDADEDAAEPISTMTSTPRRAAPSRAAPAAPERPDKPAGFAGALRLKTPPRRPRPASAREADAPGRPPKPEGFAGALRVKDSPPPPPPPQQQQQPPAAGAKPRVTSLEEAATAVEEAAKSGPGAYAELREAALRLAALAHRAHASSTCVAPAPAPTPPCGAGPTEAAERTDTTPVRHTPRGVARRVRAGELRVDVTRKATTEESDIVWPEDEEPEAEESEQHAPHWSDPLELPPGATEDELIALTKIKGDELDEAKAAVARASAALEQGPNAGDLKPFLKYFAQKRHQHADEAAGKRPTDYIFKRSDELIEELTKGEYDAVVAESTTRWKQSASRKLDHLEAKRNKRWSDFLAVAAACSDLQLSRMRAEQARREAEAEAKREAEAEAESEPEAEAESEPEPEPEPETEHEFEPGFFTPPPPYKIDYEDAVVYYRQRPPCDVRDIPEEVLRLKRELFACEMIDAELEREAGNLAAERASLHLEAETFELELAAVERRVEEPEPEPELVVALVVPLGEPAVPPECDEAAPRQAAADGESVWYSLAVTGAMWAAHAVVSTLVRAAWRDALR